MGKQVDLASSSTKYIAKDVILKPEKKVKFDPMPASWRLSISVLMILLGGCGPRLDSLDPGERCLAVDKPSFTDQSALKKIALEDFHEAVRCSAVVKLNDEAVLAQVAGNDSNYVVRGLAVKKLKDQKTIGRIATKDVHAEVRMQAIMNLNDEIVLQQVALADEMESNCLIALNKIKIQSLLVNIAIASKYYHHRLIAIERISELDSLKKVLISYRKSPTFWNAEGDVSNKILGICGKKIQLITEQSSLKKIALEAEVEEIRYYAVAKLSDQGVLADIAMKQEESVEIREQAVRLLTTMEVLAKIACTTKIFSIVALVVDKISDQRLLTTIANCIDDNSLKRGFGSEYGQWNYRHLGEDVVKKISDDLLLEEIVYNGVNYSTRESAISRIRNQEILDRIALSAPVSFTKKVASLIEANLLRRKVIERLTNQTTLLKVAINDSDESCSTAALQRIRDPKDAVSVLRLRDRSDFGHDDRREVAEAILNKIDDLDLLIETALETSSSYVGAMALEVLSKRYFSIAYADITKLPLSIKQASLPYCFADITLSRGPRVKDYRSVIDSVLVNKTRYSAELDNETLYYIMRIYAGFCDPILRAEMGNAITVKATCEASDSAWYGRGTLFFGLKVTACVTVSEKERTHICSWDTGLPRYLKLEDLEKKETRMGRGARPIHNSFFRFGAGFPHQNSP